VDPGTTTGLAAIDLCGNVVDTYSAKNLSLSKIIDHITSLGKPVVVACDVMPAPRMVRKLASSLKCRIFEPQADMKIRDKIEIIAGHDEPANWHEKDALAAALFAKKDISKTLNKVDRAVSGEEREEIKYLLLSEKARNLTHAIELIGGDTR